MKPLPLRTSVVLALLLALLPIVLLTGWRTWSEVRAERDRVDAALVESAVSLSNSVDRELASSLQALQVLSQSELFQQGRISAMGRLLQGRPRRDWDSIFLLDRDGAMVLDTGLPHAAGLALPTSATAPALRDLHAQVLAQLKPFVSGLIEAATPARSYVAIALPVLQGNTARYVLGVRIGQANWQRLVGRLAVPEGGHASLLDRGGHPIADGLTAQLAAYADTAVYSATQAIAMPGWTARVAVPREPVDAAQRHIVLTALLTSGACVLLGLLLASAAAVDLLRNAQRPDSVSGKFLDM